MIDINCDLGEGIDEEEKIMPFITSANIACGGHFGDKVSIRKTITLCRKFGIKVGVHPSYPDFENFGRISLNIDKEDLIDMEEVPMHTKRTLRSSKMRSLSFSRLCES